VQIPDRELPSWGLVEMSFLHPSCVLLAVEGCTTHQGLLSVKSTWRLIFGGLPKHGYAFATNMCPPSDERDAAHYSTCSAADPIHFSQLRSLCLYDFVLVVRQELEEGCCFFQIKRGLDEHLIFLQRLDFVTSSALNSNVVVAF
jgi:hypothetical protein